MLFVLTRILKTVVVLLTFAPLIVSAQQPLPDRRNQDIAFWERLQPRIDAELARHRLVCESSNWKVRVADAVDLTGDGVPEAAIDWCVGASTDLLILMRLEEGRPVLARSREHETYGYIEFAIGTSGMHSAGYEFHPEQHAIYTIQLDVGGWTEKSMAKDVTAHVTVYVWNPETKTFDRDRRLSKQESEARTDKKPSRSH